MKLQEKILGHAPESEPKSTVKEKSWFIESNGFTMNLFIVCLRRELNMVNTIVEDTQQIKHKTLIVLGDEVLEIF